MHFFLPPQSAGGRGVAALKGLRESGGQFPSSPRPPLKLKVPCEGQLHSGPRWGRKGTIKPARPVPPEASGLALQTRLRLCPQP